MLTELNARLLSASVAATVALSLAGCPRPNQPGGDGGTNGGTDGNGDGNGNGNGGQTIPLTVDGGPDKSVVVGDSVVLAATAAGGTGPYSFRWLQSSGPTQPISPPGGQSAAITVAGSAAGTAALQVQVTDSTSATATDFISVTVTDSPIGLTFTLGVDNLAGTDGIDVFRAPSVDVSGTGAFQPTFQSSDAADGLDAEDILNATFAGPAVPPIAVALAGIETLNLTDIATGGSQQFVAADFVGVAAINSVNSTNPLILIDLPALVALCLIDTSAGLNAQFIPAVVAGPADALVLTVQDVTGGDVVLSGIETVDILSHGSDNRLARVNAAGLTRIAVSGTKALTIDAPAPPTVTIFDASDLTAGGFSVITANAAAAFTGGAGDDAVTFQPGLFGPNAAADGNAGRDTLRLAAVDAANVTAPRANISEIEELAISTLISADINATFFGTIDTLRLEGELDADPPRVLTMPAGARVIVEGFVSGSDPTLTVAGTGNVALTIAETARFPGIVLQPGGRTITRPLFDVITFTGTPSATLELPGELDREITTITLTDTPAVETLTITGDATLVLGGVFADAIDASGLAGGLSILATSSAIAGTTGTPGDDELVGPGPINAGAGNDVLRPFTGVQTITLGAGADRLVLLNGSGNGQDRKIVTDFDDTAGTGDVLAFSAFFLPLSGTDDFTSAASIRDHTSGTVFIGAATELLRINDVQLSGLTGANSLNGTNLLAVLGGGIVLTPGNAILVAIKSESTPVIGGFKPAGQIIPPIFGQVEIGLYYGRDGDENAQLTAPELTLIAVLQGTGVRLADMVFQNFAIQAQE